jgi:hypothetical protein
LYPRKLKAVQIVSALAILAPWGAAQPAPAPGAFSFVVTADVRYFTGPGIYDTAEYFKGALQAIQDEGGGAFMISPGDIDPPASAYWSITSTLGIDYLWYPVIGNHELPGAGHEASPGANVAWLRTYAYDANGAGIPPDIANPGPLACPTTTYSFDYQNAHLVVLNEYCDTSGDIATDGDVPDYLYGWLAADLSATNQPLVFVIGHEPAYPQEDADTGRMRHLGDSLDKYPFHRDRFWQLLRAEGVVAYICGHTHNYSAVLIDGVWQIDAGHARGAGDTGTPSTFVVIHVDGSTVRYDAYRDIYDAFTNYDKSPYSGLLAPLNYQVYLPLLQR